MLLLLIISLLVYVLIAYKYRKDLLSISVVSGCMFMLSTSIACIYRIQWDVDMNFIGYFSIVCSLITMLLGELLGYNSKGRLSVKYLRTKCSSLPYTARFSRIWMIISTVFMFFSLYIYYRESVRMAGNIKTGSSLLVANIRLAKSLGERMPSYVSYLYLICNCLAYVYTFIVEKNVITGKDKIRKYILEILNVFAYLAMTVLTTGRSEFIEFIMYAVSLGVMLNSINYRVKINSKILRRVFMGVVIAFLAFYFMGTLTGKSQRFSVIQGVSRYVGGSIAAYSHYMKDPIYNDGYWGQHTLFGVYSFCNRFLGTNFVILERPLEFTKIGITSINIYTAIRRYIQDFGLEGSLIISSFIGYVFGKVGKKVLDNNFAMIVYAMMIFVGVEFSFEERFFMTVITTGFLYKIVLIYMLYRYLEKKTRIMPNLVNSVN